ncbi:MAG: S8 family serine peptidase, partial [Firmicutes bacterium]|nr:S8 family serine peptidase [Bacillota bacterium]
FDFSDEAEAADAMRRLKRDSRVAFVEYDYPKYLMGVAPNDTMFSAQWSHAFTDAVTGWEVTGLTEQREIIVAVIDTGAKTNHEDLIDRLKNPYNAVDGGADVTDTNWHGTFVSGIIAASANNGKGVAGVVGGFNIKVMPIKVDGAEGIKTSDYLAGLEHAITSGADVINISLGSKSFSPAEKNKITQAVNQGIVVVAASGNSSAEDDIGPTDLVYPAAHEMCISVASHDKYGERSYFSVANPFVDITAPGEAVRSTYFNGGYATSSGTSFSSPYVAGIAAMIKASDLLKTPYDIHEILTSTAISPPGQSGRTNEHGYGYVNVATALRAVYNFDYNAEVRLNWDTVHLTQDVDELILTAQSDGSNDTFVWYKSTDHSVATGGEEYVLSKGGARGSNYLTAKIPLGTKQAVCYYSWDSSTAPESLSGAVNGLYIKDGMLMSYFYLNKYDYFINAQGGQIPEIISIDAADGVFYKIKNSGTLNGESVVTTSAPNDSRTFTFIPKQFNDGLYPYYAEDENSVIFAVTAYNTAGVSYNAQMVCAVYEGNKLVDLSLLPIEIKNGYTIKEVRMTVSEGQSVKVIFLDSFEGLTPISEYLPYERVVL